MCLQLDLALFQTWGHLLQDPYYSSSLPLLATFVLASNRTLNRLCGQIIQSMLGRCYCIIASASSSFAFVNIQIPSGEVMIAAAYCCIGRQCRQHLCTLDQDRSQVAS